MHSETPTLPASKKLFWAGWILTIAPALMLLMSGSAKLAAPPEVVEGFAKLGWDMKLATALAIVEIVCTIVYLIPRTAVLGAILVTGYLGGAVAAHVRLSESFHMPVILGVLVWCGLYLRDSRLRALVPLRR